jgi:cytochrome c
MASGSLLIATMLALISSSVAQAQTGYGSPGYGMGSGMMGQGMNSGMMGQGMGPGMMGPGMMRNGTAIPPTATAPAASSGAGVFAGQCAACHSLRVNAPAMAGPDLHGLFGRRAGTAPGFSYSPALRGAGVVWNSQTLDSFLAAPQTFIPGARMAYPGIVDTGERKALIDYLRAATQ